MTEPLHLTDCPKFTLLLKSHTQKKRLIEAKNKLLNVYPFEVRYSLNISKTVNAVFDKK